MSNRRPARGPAIARGTATTPPVVRFPCGHLEGQPAVTGRTHEIARAVWVACRRCNLIVVATAQIPVAGRPTAAHP